VPVATTFTSNYYLSVHFGKHGEKAGAVSENDYEDKARNFLNTPLQDDPDIEDPCRTNGCVVRYNKRTNEFAIMTPTGKILTYYTPTRACDVDLSVYPVDQTHNFPTNYDYFVHESQKQ